MPLLNNGTKIYLGEKLICGGNSATETSTTDAPVYINKEGQLYRQVFYDDFNSGDIDHNYWREDYMPSRVQTSYNAYSDVRCEDSILKLRCKQTMGCRDGTENGSTIAVSTIQSAAWNGMHLPNPTFHDFRPWYGLIAQEGYYEIKAKLPLGSGVHSGLWMVGTENTSRGLTETCEIDVFEVFGNAITTIPFNVYPNGDTNIAQTRVLTDVKVDLSLDFHIYGFMWENGIYKLYFDGNLILTKEVITPGYPMMFFMTAYRRQSGTGTTGDADPTLPDTEMQVDYFKIYKKATTVQNSEVTVSSFDEITVSVPKGKYTVNENSGFLTAMPLYCYANWSDGSRTEHWVKWDRFDDKKKEILNNGGALKWDGVVYGLGNQIEATINVAP